MKIITKDFIEGGNIPADFTCDGEGKMFDLKVTEVPAGTKSLAIIIEDPDAPSGVFTHFVAWNIPVIESVVDCSDLVATSSVGKFSSGSNGYVPPCPPEGIHRYFVKFFAVSEILNLEAGSTRQELEKMLADKVIEQAQVMGLYSRTQK
jgi:Raf kinase inhibitor-like YbhB/YbcL family protein